MAEKREWCLVTVEHDFGRIEVISKPTTRKVVRSLYASYLADFKMNGRVDEITARAASVEFDDGQSFFVCVAQILE